MATYAITTSTQRPKKLVKYGKSASRSTWSTKHVDNWLDEEDSDIAAPSAKRVQTVKATYQVQKPEVKEEKKQESAKSVLSSTKPTLLAKQHVSKPAAKRSEKPQDLFDVPSSEDEAEEEFVLRRPAPPKARYSKSLVHDTEVVEALAPWEQKTTTATNARTLKVNASAEAQLKSDLTKVAQRSEGGDRASLKAPGRTKKAKSATSTTAKEPLTAAARLAARRQQTSALSSSQATTTVKPLARSGKRNDAAEEATLARPPKRARKASPPSIESEDMVMTEATPDLCVKSPRDVPGVAEDIDVYHFPADDETTLSLVAMKPKQTTEKSKRRPASSSARATPVTGLSAPARLAEMLPVDTDSTDAPSRSPSVLHSRTSTPRRSATPQTAQKASIPARYPTVSLSPANKAAATLTPKQAQLWSQLLPSDPPAPSPSSLAMKDLRLGRSRRPVDKVPSLANTLTKSKSDVPELHTCRVRLVDRLKAAASSSDSDSSGDESDRQDVVVSNVQPTKAKDGSQESQATITQSQSQSQAAAESGPRITYARTRSYLPEDNPEDALLFGLPAFTPAKPAVISRQASRTNVASQKSAFDLDDSDEEAGTGRMRTIHELRAAGRNNRFMQETETLLEDIAQNNSSSRSRRRGALAELATKLMDKGYAERFCDQGFERMLADSIVTCTRDLVADVLAMAVVALLLLAEPPEHVVIHLKERGVIATYTYMLKEETDFSKLVKERKHNIAKATQSTFASFTGTMLAHEALWGSTKPAVMSPRILALKTLDLLVGRLRRLGDRSELLDGSRLQLLLPESSEEEFRATVDTGLTVSLLEVISSSALMLQWPEDLLQWLATLLPMLGEEAAAPNHTVFLALRLTLNLTNDNARNCGIFASQEKTIQYLMASVQHGFTVVESTQAPTETEPTAEQDTLAYDLLVLSMGSLINLAEHSPLARQHTIASPQTKATLSSLLTVFDRAQDNIENAESLTESSTNVAFGYLAVMLANLCLDDEVKDFIASRLPGKHLGLLIESVEEFVKHHERVDALGFEGAEGREVWGAFTEKLRGVLGRLRGVAGVVDV